MTRFHVYAGTAGHSAWFSDDGGVSWVHPNSHSGLYLEARVWAFAAHHHHPETLLAGTDLGLYRWHESSARWSEIASPMRDVWALAVAPDDPDLVIAGTRPGGLYRSEDGGVTWEATHPRDMSQFSTVNMGPTRVTQVHFDAVDPDVVWASVEIAGIYRSGDRGRTWQLRTQGLTSTDVHGVLSLRRADGSRLVLATTNRGLHRSEDGGESWRLQELPAPWQYTRAIASRGDGKGVLFVANGNGPPGNDGRLLRSDDFGATWRMVSLPGEVNSSIWCIATHPGDPACVFTCSNLGQLFRSEDGGETWHRLPQEFGELRALYWRPLPEGIRVEPHSLTRRVVRASEASTSPRDGS